MLNLLIFKGLIGRKDPVLRDSMWIYYLELVSQGCLDISMHIQGTLIDPILRACGYVFSSPAFRRRLDEYMRI